MSKRPRTRRPQTAAKIYVLHAVVRDHDVTKVNMPERIDGSTLRSKGLRIGAWQLLTAEDLMSRWVVVEVRRGPHKGRFWAVRGDWFSYDQRRTGDPRQWWSVREHVGFPTEEAAIMWAVMQ